MIMHAPSEVKMIAMQTKAFYVTTARFGYSE